MVATAFASQQHTRQNVAADELVVRVFGPSRNGQIVRLKAHKCTIGAGKRCSLRLLAPGVAPLHCLIVRGREGAVVRRWAADTLLNQRAFDVAPLSPGDRLSVGPVELEILGVGANPQQPPEAVPADDSAIRAELDAQRRALEHQRRQWQAEQDESRQKLDERLAQLSARTAELETQRNALDEQRRRWETEREQKNSQATIQIEKLQARLADLENERRSFDGQRLQWQAEHEESRRKMEEQFALLSSQTAEFEAQRNALDEERSRWESERNDAASRTTVQTDQLKARLEELEAEHGSLDGQRRQWQAEQDESRRKIEEQLAQLSRQTADLESQRKMLAEERSNLRNEQNILDEQRRKWEAERERCLAAEERRPEESAPASEPKEIEYQESAKSAPVDLEDVFRRIGAKIDATEAEAEVETADRTAEKPAAVVKEHEEEESIDDYMSRLMQRVQATTGGAAAPSYSPPPAARRRPAAAPAEESMEPSLVSQLPAAPRREPAQAAPRAEAPEKLVNLTALRELANISAHNAITRYSRRIMINSMYSKLLVALVALAAAGSMMWLWKSRTGLQITFYSGLAALLVAIYWGVEYALLSGRLKINKSGHIEWQSSAGYGQGSVSTMRSKTENTAEKIPGGGEPRETASGSRIPESPRS